MVDPAKLNAVLSAVAEGVRGNGERIGQATTALNQVLLALNPRSDTIRQDWQSFGAFNDTYGAAAARHPEDPRRRQHHAATVTNHAKDLDGLLLNVIGLSNSRASICWRRTRTASSARSTPWIPRRIC